MSRRGAEAKPAWRDVPADVRREAERILGSRVARAERVFGGYAPSATFRMRLANGRRAFFKGIDASSNDYMRWALGQEGRVYTRIPDLIRPWAPRFLGALGVRDWRALLLEDVGPAGVPPWTRAKALAAVRSFAAFHARTHGRPLPRWLPRHRLWAPFAQFWGDLEKKGLGGSAALAGRRRREAGRWLGAALPVLRRAAERLARARPPYALLHVDVRSDNVRLDGALLRMFDWPNACVGPVEFDVVAFLQAIAAEGGPSPEDLLHEYERRLALRPDVLDSSASAVAGYFAVRAWQPPIPGLPRVRSIQRRQLKASLPWAARRLGLPEPAWVDAIRD